MIILNKGRLLCATLLTVIIHEFCHFLAAKRRGYDAAKFTLMPYGAVLSIDGGLNDTDLFYVAIAGPAGNLLLSVLFLALWWLVPASYSYTQELFRANIAIALFNLLPLYPLDGSRILASFVKDKLKCRKATVSLSYVFAAVCALLYIISAFFKISHAFAIVSVMLYIGAAFPPDNERYALIWHNLYQYRDLSVPLEKKELYVCASAKVSTITNLLKPKYIYVIHVVDGALNVIKTLTDKEVESLFFAEKNRPVGAVVKIND